MEKVLNRRTFVMSAGAASLAMAAMPLAGSVFAAETKAPQKTGDAKLDAVIAATAECIQTCQACVAHCLEMFKKGHSAMAECHASVLNCMELCETTNKLATYGTLEKSKLKKLIALCGSLCEDCAAACKPHAEHMDVCKACMDSCKKCAKACEAFA